jgi:ribosomal protein RSM22 (predicted rRNA methylase)
MHLPIELARAIEEEASRHDRAALLRAVAKISGRYHAEGARSTGRLSDVERAAYVAVRAPAIYGALREVFAELQARIPDAQVGTLLDLGAGPGTAAWAAASVWPALSEITCIERDRGLIELGRRLTRMAPARWIEADLDDTSPLPRADLVVLSYVAGELDAPGPLIDRAWAAAALALVIVEPGTPRGFSAIRAARAQLIRSGAAIAAPCPHAGECPMNTPDWCHFAARIERSKLHRQLKSGELGHEDEKFSYVIASRAPVCAAVSRVVRHPWITPGLIRLELCTVANVKSRTVRKREKELFRLARKAHWGGEFPV